MPGFKSYLRKHRPRIAYSNDPLKFVEDKHNFTTVKVLKDRLGKPRTMKMLKTTLSRLTNDAEKQIELLLKPYQVVEHSPCKLYCDELMKEFITKSHDKWLYCPIIGKTEQTDNYKYEIELTERFNVKLLGNLIMIPHKTYVKGNRIYNDCPDVKRGGYFFYTEMDITRIREQLTKFNNDYDLVQKILLLYYTRSHISLPFTPNPSTQFVKLQGTLNKKPTIKKTISVCNDCIELTDDTTFTLTLIVPPGGIDAIDIGGRMILPPLSHIKWGGTDSCTIDYRDKSLEKYTNPGIARNSAVFFGSKRLQHFKEKIEIFEQDSDDKHSSGFFLKYIVKHDALYEELTKKWEEEKKVHEHLAHSTVPNQANLDKFAVIMEAMKNRPKDLTASMKQLQVDYKKHQDIYAPKMRTPDFLRQYEYLVDYFEEIFRDKKRHLEEEAAAHKQLRDKLAKQTTSVGRQAVNTALTTAIVTLKKQNSYNMFKKINNFEKTIDEMYDATEMITIKEYDDDDLETFHRQDLATGR